MCTDEYTFRRWLESFRLVRVLRLIALFLLLSSTLSVTLLADDPGSVVDPPIAVDPPTEDIAATESGEPSVLPGGALSENVDETLGEGGDPLKDDGGTADGIEAVADPVSDVAINGDIDDTFDVPPMDALPVNTPLVDAPSVDANESVEAAHVDPSPSAGNESGILVADGSAAVATSETPAPAVAEIVNVQESSPSVAAWKLLQPSYSSQTPLPVSGKAMYYNPGVMERVLENRLKFKRIELCEECIGRVAMLRSGDVNRKIWLQFYGSHLEGPFHVIDTAATQHVGMLIDRNWILDVDYQTAQRWGMRMPYVTIWEDPPLELLMANFAIPLNWNATVSPAAVFSTLPHSSDSVMAGQAEGHHTIKQNLKLQHRDVGSYVDLLSDIPSDLFVK